MGSHHSLQDPGRGWNPYPGTPPTTGLWTVGRPQSKHQVTFYDLQDDGCLLLPRSFTGTFYDLQDDGCLLLPRSFTSHLLWPAGWWVSTITQILHGYLLWPAGWWVSTITQILHKSPFMTCRMMGVYYYPDPSQVTFYDLQDDGCLLLPRSFTGTFLLDLHLEVGYTFAPFGSLSYIKHF